MGKNACCFASAPQRFDDVFSLGFVGKKNLRKRPEFQFVIYDIKYLADFKIL